jgi:phosphatidylglycerophosphatase C
MKLAIFDFDGTMTSKDSFLSFIRFAVGLNRMLFGFVYLLPVLLLYKLKWMPNDRAKEKVMTFFFKGWEQGRFQRAADNFSQTRLSGLIRPSALAKLNEHKRLGHEVVVATASIEDYLRGWCERQGVKLLATKLEVKEGYLTGKLGSPNCYGEEKVRRIKETYQLDRLEYIYVYGDSLGDRALEKIANDFFFRSFTEKNG